MKRLFVCLCLSPVAAGAAQKRLVEAAVPGFVRIDGGPRLELPQIVRQGVAGLELTVELDHCPEFKQKVPPGPETVALTCPRPAHQRLLKGPPGGRVSVRGGAFVALPIWTAHGTVHAEVHVELPDCKPFARVIRAEEREVTFACPDPAPAVVVSGPPRLSVEAEVRVGDRLVKRGPLDEIWHLEVEGPGMVSVRCFGSGLVPWHTEVSPAPGKELAVACAPVPARRFVRVRAPKNDLTWRLDRPDGAPLAGLLSLGPEGTDALVLPAKGVKPEQGQWYAVQVEREGHHQLFVDDAVDHGWVEFEVEPAAQQMGEVVLDLKAQKDREPPPPPKAGDTFNITIQQPGAQAGAQVAPPGPLELGVVGGLAFNHDRTYSAIGPKLRVKPDNDLGLSMEASLTLQFGERPVYLDRFESETHITRSQAALRIDSKGKDLRWFGSVGGFVEPEIALGLWLGGGAALPVGPVTVELGAGVPVYAQDKLGHFGLELLASLVFELPGDAK